MANLATDPQTTQAARRRSDRFPVAIPVEVKWNSSEGGTIQADAEAIEANAHGAMLQMKTCPPVGAYIDLTHGSSGETVKARVVGLRYSKERALPAVAVELAAASETFWGLTFRLKKAGAELQRLAQVIKSGDIDSRVLREFRDAVDHIRKTAWVVQEWQERHMHQRDAQTVLSLLVTERIRRATQLNNDLATDLIAQELSHEIDGISALFCAVERVHNYLAGVFSRQSGTA
jgi:methyl-accepting chemotaxis protein